MIWGLWCSRCDMILLVMTCSSNLPQVRVREIIGLYFAGLSLLPFLKKGVTKGFSSPLVLGEMIGTYWRSSEGLVLLLRRGGGPWEKDHQAQRPCVANSLAIPAVVIDMGGIDGLQLGVWSKPPSHWFSWAHKPMWYESLDTRGQFFSKSRPQIIYWKITVSRMHDRVYIFRHVLFKVSQSAILYKGTTLEFCLLIKYW